tara:strand:- start:1787 stop:2200 length:414 start_codon:yes stop_codon:yes gene_type:complete
MKQIKDRVKELLIEKEWTFADLQNMEGIVKEFAEILEKELDYGFIARMCEGEPITKMLEEASKSGDYYAHGIETFGGLFYRVRHDALKGWVAQYLKEELMNANVNFNGGIENEISERSVGGKPSKKRTTDEKKDSEE